MAPEVKSGQFKCKYCIMPKNNKKNKNNQKKPGKSSTKKRPKPKRQASVQGIGLTECAAKYAAAIGNPFSPQAIGACIPTFPCRESFKVSARKFGAFQVGASYRGFVAVSPCLANDVVSIWNTLGSYQGSTFTVDPSAPQTGLVSSAFDTLPFTASELSDTTKVSNAEMAGRIISTSIRIRYIGTQLNFGGRCYAYVDPAHGNLNGQSMETIGGRKGCLRVPVSREWTEITVFANTDDEVAYPVSANHSADMCDLLTMFPLSSRLGIASGTTDIGGFPIVIAINSTAANDFEYEIVTHAEYVGALAASVVTRSHTDLDGFSHVQDAGGRNVMARTDSRTSWSSFASELMGSITRNRHNIANGMRLFQAMNQQTRNARRSIEYGY